LFPSILIVLLLISFVSAEEVVIYPNEESCFVVEVDESGNSASIYSCVDDEDSSEGTSPDFPSFGPGDVPPENLFTSFCDQFYEGQKGYVSVYGHADPKSYCYQRLVEENYGVSQVQNVKTFSCAGVFAGVPVIKNPPLIIVPGSTFNYLGPQNVIGGLIASKFFPSKCPNEISQNSVEWSGNYPKTIDAVKRCIAEGKDSFSLFEPTCIPNTEFNCNDGKDNDYDGLNDCEDYLDCEDESCGDGCECLVKDPPCLKWSSDPFTGQKICAQQGIGSKSGYKKETDCTDGIDNDDDIIIDCADTDCSTDDNCINIEEGESCFYDEQCVSGKCQQDEFGEEKCGPIIDSCESNSDCDSNYCLLSICSVKNLGDVCSSNPQCASGNCVYIEEYDEYNCVEPESGCISDNDCVDDNPCNSDQCLGGTCKHAPNPYGEGCCENNVDCDDTNYNTVDICQDDNQCSNLGPTDNLQCGHNGDCDSGVCVDGKCQAGESCTSHPECLEDENGDGIDDNPATVDYCLNNVCQHTCIPGSCGGICVCTNGQGCSAGICVDVPEGCKANCDMDFDDCEGSNDECNGGLSSCLDDCVESIGPAETDTDGDGVMDDVDNCPFTASPNQADNDNDGIGNTCDADIDGDGEYNAIDSDVDGDGDYNNVDEDIDGDGVLNEDDETPNGIGSEDDIDADGVDNKDDNCIVVANPEQEDDDGNGVGDACEEMEEDDADDDGVLDEFDVCDSNKPGKPVYVVPNLNAGCQLGDINADNKVQGTDIDQFINLFNDRGATNKNPDAVAASPVHFTDGDKIHGGDIDMFINAYNNR
jgi:hypothetical protein